MALQGGKRRQHKLSVGVFARQDLTDHVGDALVETWHGELEPVRAAHAPGAGSGVVVAGVVVGVEVVGHLASLDVMFLPTATNSCPSSARRCSTEHCRHT